MSGGRKRLAILGRGLLELVVIILGVLIALAVDEWRDDVREGHLGDAYAQRLISDLEETEAALAFGEANSGARYKLAIWFLGQVSGRDPRAPTDHLAIVAMKLSGGPISRVPYLGSRSTYDELLSTGGLLSLRADSVRDALSTYYTDWERVADRVEALPRGHWEWIRSILSPEAQIELRSANCPELPESMEDCPVEVSDYDRARLSRRIEEGRDQVEENLNLLGQYWGWLEGILRSQRERTRDLIDMLEKYRAS